MVLLALVLTGCRVQTDWKPDIIVDIPLNPTEPSDQPTETAPPETEAPTEMPTEAPTEMPTTDGSHGECSPPRTEPVTEPPEPAMTYDPSGYRAGSLDRAVAEAVNAERQTAGLDALPLDARLSAIASVRARELAVSWSHTRPDGSGWQTVLGQYGYGYARAAENLWFGTGGGTAIVEKWMGSEAHRETILSDHTAIGVGSYTSPDGVTYVAAIFAG